jgi:hypothetical protein
VKHIILHAFVLIFFYPAFVIPAIAESPVPLKDWAISMENTTRYENYDFWGDAAGSPYQNTGGQFYNELSVSFSRQLSPYESFRSRFDLLYNDSLYRSQYNGFVLERANLTWEKGNAPVPFRTQIGDNFSFMTMRTIQRSLKGFQLELQPQIASVEQKQSLLFFTGAGRDDYRDFAPVNDLFSGASYLIEDKKLGNYSFNLLQNHRASEIKDSLPARNQLVGSITGDKAFSFLKQKITLEGEAAYFTGDYNLTSDTTETGKDSFGLFGQFSAETGTPFNYRLRYENYGRNYRPNASSVNRDYEGYEAHGGWRFSKGLNLRGRLQHFVDAASSTNPTETYVAGTNLTGPLAVSFLPGLTSALDAFIQDVKSRDRTTNTRTASLNMNFGIPVKTWAAKLAFIGRHVENFADNVNWTEQRSYETNISATHAIALGPFTGSITPGLIYQNLCGNATNRDNYGINLGLQLANAIHQIGFDARFLSQNAYAPGTSNELSNNVAFNYRFSMGPHIFGFETNYTDRDPTPGTATGQSSSQAYRIAIFYTFKLDKEPGKPVSSMFSKFALQPEEATATGSIVSPFSIGQPLQKAIEGLAAQGITGGLMMPGLVVYEARLLNEIDQRQRLALSHDEKIVTKTALIIDFDDVGNQNTVSQSFERVRSILLKRFGAPVDTFEQGQFSPNFARDVNAGKLVRIIEWQTSNGLVRFGMPQRLDRQIRMELQYASRFPSRNETFWSVEEVR